MAHSPVWSTHYSRSGHARIGLKTSLRTPLAIPLMVIPVSRLGHALGVHHHEGHERLEAKLGEPQIATTFKPMFVCALAEGLLQARAQRGGHAVVMRLLEIDPASLVGISGDMGLVATWRSSFLTCLPSGFTPSRLLQRAPRASGSRGAFPFLLTHLVPLGVHVSWGTDNDPPNGCSPGADRDPLLAPEDYKRSPPAGPALLRR